MLISYTPTLYIVKYTYFFGRNRGVEPTKKYPDFVGDG